MEPLIKGSATCGMGTPAVHSYILTLGTTFGNYPCSATRSLVCCLSDTSVISCLFHVHERRTPQHEKETSSSESSSVEPTKFIARNTKKKSSKHLKCRAAFRASSTGELCDVCGFGVALTSSKGLLHVRINSVSVSTSALGREECLSEAEAHAAFPNINARSVLPHVGARELGELVPSAPGCRRRAALL